MCRKEADVLAWKRRMHEPKGIRGCRNLLPLWLPGAQKAGLATCAG